MPIGTPVEVVGHNNKTSESSRNITTTAAIPAGALFYFGIARDPAGQTTNSVAIDGNSLTQRVIATNGSGTTGVVMELWTLENCPALASGVTVAITWSGNVTAKAMNGGYIEGIVTSGSLDQTGTATGSSGTPSVSTDAATSQADEITIGYLATEGPDTDSFTQDSSPAYATPPARRGTGGGSADVNMTVAGGHFIETSTGVKTYNPTVTSRDWAAVIATFKGLGGSDFVASATGAASFTGAATAASALSAEAASEALFEAGGTIGGALGSAASAAASFAGAATVSGALASSALAAASFVGESMELGTTPFTLAISANAEVAFEAEATASSALAAAAAVEGVFVPIPNFFKEAPISGGWVKELPIVT